MGRKACLALVLLLLLASTAAAQSDGSSSLRVRVWEDGTSEIEAELLVDSRGLSSIVVPASRPEFVSVNDDSSTLRYAALKDEILIAASRNEEQYPLFLTYQTATLTSKQDEVWSWSLELDEEFWQQLDDLALVVTIPEQGMLVSYTEGGVVYSDQGVIHVGWRLDSHERFEVSYELDSGRISAYSEGPETDEVIVVVLIALLAGAIILLIYQRYVRRFEKKEEDILSALDGKERAVMEVLLEAEKEMTQTKIAKSTGLSKATVSRAVRRLEDKELIELRDFGTAHLISPSKRFGR